MADGWVIKKVGKIVEPVELAGGEGDVISVEITRPNDTTAYTANDILNDKLASFLEIPGIARKPGGSFILHGVEFGTDQGGGAQVWQPVIWLFKEQRPTPLADNAVYALTYTQRRNMGKLDRLLLPALTAPAGTTTDEAQITDLARVYKCASTKTSAFFELQTLTAFTPSALSQWLVTFHVTRL